MVEQFKRHTAYKVWIGGIHKNPIVRDENGSSKISIGSLQVARVNLIGGVIDAFKSENYGSLLVDDGSGTIRLKVWGEDLGLFEDKQVGDLVLVVGRVGEFNEERYVRPEIVRKISTDWALLRRLELVQKFGAPKKEEKVEVSVKDQPQKEVEPSLAAREAILNTIEKLEEVDEAKLVEACAMPREKVMVALNDLLKEGEVFSPKKGLYRLV